MRIKNSVLSGFKPAPMNNLTTRNLKDVKPTSSQIRVNIV